MFQEGDKQLIMDFAESSSSLCEGERKALEVVFEESRLSVDVSPPKKHAHKATK